MKGEVLALERGMLIIHPLETSGRMNGTSVSLVKECHAVAGLVPDDRRKAIYGLVGCSRFAPVRSARPLMRPVIWP